MRKSLKLTVFAVTLSVAMQTGAQVAVIDFNGLTDPGGSGLVDRGFTYTEDGFQLDELALQSFISVHSPNPSFTGSVSFFRNTCCGVARLTKIGGGGFDLDSIDLDSFNGDFSTVVTFTGTHSDLSTVSQSFTTATPFPEMQTFAFGAAFDNVIQVDWIQADTTLQFDNITVDQSAGGADVPEPMTLSLLRAGLAGIGLARRRA